MKNLFSNLYETVKTGEPVMLVSVIGDSGSTPRGAGARMAVRTDGTSTGTIGGGAVEYRSVQLAVEAMKQKKSYIEGFNVADLGMICGGDMEVYFQYIAGNHSNIFFLEDVTKQLTKNENSWLVTEIIDESNWKMSIHAESSGELVREEGKKYFIEALSKAGKVYIFGGGHISQKLVPVLDSVDFKCIVIDDKLEFANAELFPLADTTVVADFAAYSNKITAKPCDYVAILTRGHKNDYEALVQALRTEACYIGLIGSRTKLGKTKQRLLEDGFSEEDFNRVHAPIGIAIKAETPQEIAISIAGEMIRVRAELNNAK